MSLERAKTKLTGVTGEAKYLGDFIALDPTPKIFAIIVDALPETLPPEVTVNSIFDVIKTTHVPVAGRLTKRDWLPRWVLTASTQDVLFSGLSGIKNTATSQTTEIERDPHTRFEMGFTHPRITGTLEPYLAYARYDRQSDFITLFTNSQAPTKVQRALGETENAALDNKSAQIVGGAFGGKHKQLPIEVALRLAETNKSSVVMLIPPALLPVGAPVHFNYQTNGKNHLISARIETERPDSVHEAKARQHLTDGGIYDLDTILGGKVICEVNPYIRRNPFTHPSVVRSGGANQPVAFIEALVAHQAKHRGIDPWLFRVQHMKPEAYMRFAPLVKETLEIKNELVASSLSADKGHVIGMGIGWYETGFPELKARLRFRPEEENRLVIETAYTDLGQALGKAMKLIAAEKLGCDPQDITIVNSPDLAVQDTAASASLGTFYEAMEDFSRRLRRSLNIHIGNLVPHIGKRTFSYKSTPEPAKRLHWNRISYIAALIDMTVDQDTGSVQLHQLRLFVDAGKIYDRVAAEAQIIGGAAHGIGDALLLTPNNEADYATQTRLYYQAIPKSTQIPPISVQFLNSENLPFPIGVGEIGTMPIYQAIYDGLNTIVERTTGRPLPAHFSFPLTSEKVWRLLTRY